jgi:hypothetical protein
MAGSKSLELYLPQEGKVIPKEAPIITINSPKRLHDALSLLNDMFKKLDSIIFTTSDFGTKLKDEDLKSINFVNSSEGMKDFVQYSNKFLDESNKKVTDIRKSLEGLKKHAE